MIQLLKRLALTGLVASVVVAVTHAQWLNYKAPGVPRRPDGTPDLAARMPRTVGGTPDLSGIWVLHPPKAGRNRLEFFMEAGAKIPTQPWAEQLFNRRLATSGVGRPSESCLPHGIPDAYTVPGFPFKIVQTPGLIAMLFEEFNQYRQIFTDGRKHPADMNPTWLGYSVATWDGDVLEVESKGFNDRSWLDNLGHPHTDALAITERFRRRDFGHLATEITIRDSNAYTAPFSLTIDFDLLVDTEMIESICENEKDRIHLR